MTYKPRLRYRKFDEYPKVNALRFIICPPTPTAATFREVKSSQMKAKERDEGQDRKEKKEKFRFVRVEDRLFKVPEGFFLQMPLQIQEAIKFSIGHGSTPEKPIFLHHQSQDQFKQILSTYNAFPNLDAHSFTLDHLLTVGELSIHYGLRHLVDWFFPAFSNLIREPHSPLRTMPNYFYVRMMKLALQMKSMDLVGVIQASWANRIHSRELYPVWALLFADLYGLYDLLGHSCYAYLMGVHSKVEKELPFNERELLSPRQLLYIRAGYHSLRTFWNVSGRLAPEFERDPECVLHTQCVNVWKLRWAAFLTRMPGTFPEVDVLNRLGFMLARLKDDTILAVCLSSSCRASALRTLAKKRDQASHQLHHHFDV